MTIQHDDGDMTLQYDDDKHVIIVNYRTITWTIVFVKEKGDALENLKHAIIWWRKQSYR